MPAPLVVVMLVVMVGVPIEVGLIDAGGGGGDGGGGGLPPPIWMPTALPVLLTVMTPLFVMPPVNEDWLTLMPKALPPVPPTAIVPPPLLTIPLVTTDPPVTKIPPGVPPPALIVPLFWTAPLIVALLIKTVAGCTEAGAPMTPAEPLLTLPCTRALFVTLRQSSEPRFSNPGKSAGPTRLLQAQAFPPSPAMIASAEVAERAATRLRDRDFPDIAPIPPLSVFRTRPMRAV